MLNSAEYEIFHANKSEITNNANYFLLNIAEHENFSAISFISEKISCSVELSMKKVL